MSEKNDGPSECHVSDTEREAGVEVPKGNAFQRLVHRKNDLNELGRDMLQQSLQYDRAQLEADAIKVRWKLDLIVLPMVRYSG